MSAHELQLFRVGLISQMQFFPLMEIKQAGYNLNQKVLGMCQADVGGSSVGVLHVALMDLTWNCLLLP